MKKIIFVLMLSSLMINLTAQSPSNCKPGDSTAKSCVKFGMQADVTFNFIQLKATEMKNFHVAVMPGLHLCDYMFAGVGAEYAYYNTFHLFPVFAHGTINFTKGKVIPFIQGKIGYTLGSKTGPVDYNLLNNRGTYATPLMLEEVKGNFYFAPSLGVKFKAGENAKIMVALVGDLMMFKIATVADPNTYLKLKNVTMGLKVGVEF